jgi:hypothetical protein
MGTPYPIELFINSTVPVVLVLASSSVERILQQNLPSQLQQAVSSHLAVSSAIDTILVSVFNSSVSSLNERVRVRGLGGHEVWERGSFRIQFASLSTLSTNPYGASMFFVIPSTSPVPDSETNEAHFMSTYQHFRHEQTRLFVACEHTTYHHPVLILCCVSTHDEYPYAEALKLFDPRQPPSQYPRGVDTNVQRHYLLLHFGPASSTSSVEQKWTEFKKAFSEETCHFLALDVASTTVTPTSLPHSPSTTATTPSLTFDPSTLTQIMRTLLLKGVVSEIERQLRYIQDLITVTEKKVSSKWRLWSRKGGANTLSGNNGEGILDPGPPFNTLEYQYRRLGDLAFQLGDYGTARHHYRALADLLAKSSDSGSLTARALALEACALSTYLSDVVSVSPAPTPSASIVTNSAPQNTGRPTTDVNSASASATPTASVQTPPPLPHPLARQSSSPTHPLSASTAINKDHDSNIILMSTHLSPTDTTLFEEAWREYVHVCTMPLREGASVASINQWRARRVALHHVDVLLSAHPPDIRQALQVLERLIHTFFQPLPATSPFQMPVLMSSSLSANPTTLNDEYQLWLERAIVFGRSALCARHCPQRMRRRLVWRAWQAAQCWYVLSSIVPQLHPVTVASSSSSSPAAPTRTCLVYALYFNTLAHNVLSTRSDKVKRRTKTKRKAKAPSTWPSVNEALNCVLARLNYSLGNVQRAVEFMGQLLLNTTQAPLLQFTFLREYISLLHHLQEEQSTGEVRTVLPQLQPPLRIHVSESLVSMSLSNLEWSSLLNALCAQRKLPSVQAKVGVVNEPLHVTFTLRNPLRIPLSLCALRLKCAQVDVEYEEDAVTLLPLEQRVMRLSVRPRHAGLLNVLGLCFRFAPNLHEVFLPFTVLSSLSTTASSSASEGGSFVAQAATTPQPKPVDGSTLDTKQKVTTPDKVVRSITTPEDDQKNTRHHHHQHSTGGSTDNVALGASLGDDVPQRHRKSRSTSNLTGTTAAAVETRNGTQQLDRSRDILAIQITEPMPYLEVALSGEENERFATQLHAGAMHCLYLVMHNSGQVPLTSLFFTHSDATLFVLDTAYNHCLMSKSTTTHSKRITRDNGSSEVNNGGLLTARSQYTSSPVYMVPLPRGQLAPGETVSFSLWYRAPTTAVTTATRYTHKFLFQYSSVPNNRLLPFRVRCATLTVTVLPSLRLTAHIRSSPSSPFQYLLDLEVENISSDAVIQLKSVRAWCRLWTFTHIFPQTAAERESAGGCASLSPLPPQSTLNLFFRVLPSRDTQQPIIINFAPYKHPSLLLQRIPQYDFLQSEYSDVARHSGSPSLFSFTTAEHEIRKRVESHLAHALLDWELLPSTSAGSGASGGSAIECGQHHLLELKFGAFSVSPSSTALTSTSPLLISNILRVNIELSRFVTYSFAETNKLCVVPVVFHVVNASPVMTLSLKFDALKPSELLEGGSEPSRATTLSDVDYLWTGQTHFEVPELLPEKEVAFRTQVSVLRPGTFNLNRFKFSVRVRDLITNKENDFTIFYTSAQYLLTVLTTMPLNSPVL